MAIRQDALRRFQEGTVIPADRDDRDCMEEQIQRRDM
jgi:hypothetical protein